MLWLLWHWNLPLENGWEKHSPEQLEPQSRFQQLGTTVAPVRVCARSPWALLESILQRHERNYTDLFYSGTNPTSTCNYTFQKIDWVLLCQFPIQSSHIRVFSPFFPLPESHFWFWVWHCNANASLDRRLGKRGSRSGWQGKICCLGHQSLE